MTDKELFKLALDALETECDIYCENNEDGAPEYILEAITALKERLEDPMREVQRLGQEIEQEPVAWTDKSGITHKYKHFEDMTPLYTHPPQRTEQEPVAWAMDYDIESVLSGFSTSLIGTAMRIESAFPKHRVKLLYTTPPQRKPLTNGEIYTAYITATNQTLRATDERLAFAFARAIEAAHGIKENT